MRFAATAHFPGLASRALGEVAADDPWVAALAAFEPMPAADRLRCWSLAVVDEDGAEAAYSVRAGRLVRCSAVERPAPQMAVRRIGEAA